MPGSVYITACSGVVVFRSHRISSALPKGIRMIWTIFVLLICLWLIGMATAYTLGGLIHLLLVLAVVALVVRLMQGERV